MIEVLENLKNNQILYSQNVADLKECIRQRYSHDDTQRDALLFAAAIHKLIDQNIFAFEQPIQTIIKNTLLQEVVKKDPFAINAYDIFKACTTLNRSDAHYVESLTNWINHNQNQHFSQEQVAELTHYLKDPHYSTKTSLPLQPKSSILSKLTLPRNRKKTVLVTSMMILGIALLSEIVSFQISKDKNIPVSFIEPATVEKKVAGEDVFLTDLPTPTTETKQNSFLHKRLQHKEIDVDALHHWLDQKNSMLAEDPYFNSILGAAEEFNINPLLMFAITGQEQSFVPKSHVNAALIANNPFNVYGSWKHFNTDIDEASRIAARTILNLSKDRPEDFDPLKWLNKKYAEDENWHVGVGQILTHLEETAGD